MTEHDAFLTNIRENPDDDTPRLIYSDWLTEQGDPRGELIRVQCELARLDSADPRRRPLTRRANGLVRRHGPTWRKSLPSFRGVRWSGFERGFIARAVVSSVGALLEVLPALLDAAPAAEIVLDGASPGGVSRLFESPHAARIRALFVCPRRAQSVSVSEVADARHTDGLRSLRFVWADGSRGVAALAGAPQFRGLRRLELNGGQLDDVAAIALAESKSLVSLTRLDLSSNRISPDGVRALAASPRLRLNELNLNYNPIDEGGIQALARGPSLSELTHLTVGGGYHHALRASDELLASPHLPRLASLTVFAFRGGSWRAEILSAAPSGTALRRLDVHGPRLDVRSARKLAACPRLADLHELSLRDTQLGDDATKALAASPFLTDLRMLSLASNAVGDKGAAALAAAPWRRLTTLDLGRNKIGDAGVRTLVTSPVGKHASVLNLESNTFGGAGTRLLSRRRVRAWPTVREETS
jgi:uncharacterized protein (TIGR02996 family)